MSASRPFRRLLYTRIAPAGMRAALRFDGDVRAWMSTPVPKLSQPVEGRLTDPESFGTGPKRIRRGRKPEDWSTAARGLP